MTAVKRQIIITNWREGKVEHAYEDLGPGRAYPHENLVGTRESGGRVPGTKHPGTGKQGDHRS